jgi:hypothetical protein
MGFKSPLRIGSVNYKGSLRTGWGISTAGWVDFKDPWRAGLVNFKGYALKAHNLEADKIVCVC